MVPQPEMFGELEKFESTTEWIIFERFLAHV